MKAALSFFCLLLWTVCLASDCNRTSVGLIPITELGTARYLNQFQGGLYPTGSNQMPRPHALEGFQRALSIQPLNPEGQPHPNGRYVLLSIGMSNTNQEFCCGNWTFMGQAASHPDVNHRALAIVNGARGGQDAGTWDEPTDPNYNRIRDQVLTPRGLTELQVQVVWVKTANARPTSSLPHQDSDAYRLAQQYGNIVRSLKIRYPNLKQVYLSSRTYGGYSTGLTNPEPYAYEVAFAIKWVIEAQMRQMAQGQMDERAGDLDYNTVAPWIAWGPYLWADGETPRQDGLQWFCSDFENDGLHPSPAGEQKVGNLLMNFFLNSPFSRPWFTMYPVGDVDSSRCVDDEDLLRVIYRFGDQGLNLPEDVNGDGRVNDLDLLSVLFNFGSGC